MVGEIFTNVYPNGDAAQALSGVSTDTVTPGQGEVLDLIFDRPGEYMLVNHSLCSGILGVLG